MASSCNPSQFFMSLSIRAACQTSLRLVDRVIFVIIASWLTGRRRALDIDEDKIDDAVLALLYLTLHNDARAWKGFDWDVLDRLHRKEMIFDPVGKTKSVRLTEEGLARSQQLFEALFGKK